MIATVFDISGNKPTSISDVERSFTIVNTKKRHEISFQTISYAE